MKNRQFVYILLQLFNSFLLVIFKYRLNSLTFKITDLTYFGNLIDLFPALLIIAAFLFNRSGNIKIKNKKSKNIALALNPFLIIMAYLLHRSNLMKNIFLNGYSINREIVLVLLLFNYFIALFISLDYLFTKFFRRSNNIRIFTYSLLLLMSFFIISLTLNIVTQLRENNERHLRGRYLGIVLGAAVWKKTHASPILKGRLATAVHLFKRKKLKYIQVTGGKARGEISEALAAKIYLLKRGIPQKAILLESGTHSTSEQIKFIKNKLAGKYSELKLLIISDSFHLARVFEMAKFFGIKLNGISSEYKLNWQELFYYSLRDAIGITIFWLFSI